MKLLNQNLAENRQDVPSSASKGRKSTAKPKRGSAPANTAPGAISVIAKPLDWETDQVTSSLAGSGTMGSFDVVIACDCIYNDALIEPLVQTCADACKLRAWEGSDSDNPSICIVAQQLRSAEVFEGWLQAFYKSFRVWHVPDEMLIDGLKSDSGFVVHVGVLR